MNVKRRLERLEARGPWGQDTDLFEGLSQAEAAGLAVSIYASPPTKDAARQAMDYMAHQDRMAVIVNQGAE